ncbi:SAM domain-containing protein, partial [Streptomyces viridosporus]|uniref:SAM domain-containing protein n=1 Tax=Streptomyces viridosporus TaxID=67581 RepID=UPI001FCC70D0
MCHPSWGRARAAAQRLSDFARLRRVRDRIDREYAREEVQLPDTTATTVAEWLENLGLSVYAEGFFREEVAFEDLPALAEDDLVNTFEMHKIGHLRKAMASIEGLKTRNKKIPVVPVNEGAPVEDLKSKPLTNVLDANADSTASAA